MFDLRFERERNGRIDRDAVMGNRSPANAVPELHVYIPHAFVEGPEPFTRGEIGFRLCRLRIWILIHEDRTPCDIGWNIPEHDGLPDPVIPTSGIGIEGDAERGVREVGRAHV